MEAASSPYPAALTFDGPEKVANWRPLVQWFLAIPHFVLVYGLGVLAEVVGVISWFVILFTGRLPEGLAGLQCLYLRYSLRTMAYAGFLVEEYPPFAFATTGPDPGDVPRVRADFTPQLEDRNRVTAFFRIILVLPHLVVLAVLALGAFLAVVVSFFAVLFTGRWPEGLRSYVVGVMGWNIRVQAYLTLLVDEYPPFKLDT